MPILITVDHQLQKTSAIATGEITVVDIQAHLDEEKGLCGLGYRELIDASGATGTFTSEEVRQLVEIFTDLGLKNALGPTAVIVPNDLVYGVLRMLGLLLGDVCDLLPFRTTERADAEKWLATQPIVAAKYTHNTKMRDAGITSPQHIEGTQSKDTPATSATQRTEETKGWSFLKKILRIDKKPRA